MMASAKNASSSWSQDCWFTQISRLHEAGLCKSFCKLLLQ